MLRASTDEKSLHISAVLHGDGLTVMQCRDFNGDLMKDPEDEVFASGTNYDVLQIERTGKVLFMRAAHFGEPLETIGSYEMINLPDGKDREQLTFDEYNNWFPHISPDGNWIASISFPPDIEKNSHTSYKRVMLRLMPVTGGNLKAIAYLYGRQGTINVPSWSPDSRQIAFVSNSGK